MSHGEITVLVDVARRVATAAEVVALSALVATACFVVWTLVRWRR